MALSEIQIKNAKAAERPYKLADGEGLFLLVKANGSKLWRMKYRYRGKEKLLSFGAYPDVGIAAARELKTLARAALAEGKDPMVHKPGRDFEPEKTFKAVAEMWHKNRKSSLDPAHAKRVWSRMERDVFPVLGERMMHEITPPEVLGVIRNIEAHSRCGPHGSSSRRSEAATSRKAYGQTAARSVARAHKQAGSIQ